MRENRRNWRTLAIAALLMVSMTTATLAVGGYYRSKEAPEPSPSAQLPEVPQVTILGTKVTGGAYFELGLKVSAKSFQSVGAVLRYDTSVLEPVDWSGEKLALAGAGWSAPTVIPTKGADNLSGKPALAYRETDAQGADTGRGILYLGADALQYTPLDGVQTVAVRFAYAAGKGPEDVTLPGSADGGAPYTVDYAPDGALPDSIPGARLVATAGADEVFEYSDTYRASFELAEGPGVAGTGGGTTGDYAVTFFDWDGRVLDAMAAQGDMTQSVADLQKNLAALKNKAGYDFSCWLLVEQGEAGLETKNGAFVASNDAGDFDADKADFSDVQKNMLVQAAYVENSAINSGVSDGTRAFYTIDEGSAVYTRYGSASETDGRYSITYTVRRQNAVGQGVTKLRRPAVFVIMRPDLSDPSQDLISRVDLENTDETTFEVVPTRGIQQVEVRAIDTYGVPAWPSAGQRSGSTACGNAAFVENGSWGFVRDQAIATIETLGDDYLDEGQWPTGWKSEADGATFRDGGLSIPGGLTAAKRNILLAMKALSPEARRAVTQAQLQAMIGGGV